MPKMRFLLRKWFQKAQWWHQLHLPVESSVSAGNFSPGCAGRALLASHSALHSQRKGGFSSTFPPGVCPQWQHQLPLQLKGFLAIQVVEELRYLNNDFLMPLTGALLLIITKLFDFCSFRDKPAINLFALTFWCLSLTPFFAAVSSPQKLTGPSASPWLSLTFCGVRGATRKPWWLCE